MEPADNERLAKLCGVLDEHLRQIETAYDVSISRRGAHFSVGGSPAQAQLTVKALRHFYDKAGDDLSIDDIQLGLIELANSGESDCPRPPC